MPLNDIIYRGDDQEIEFKLADENGDDINITTDITGLLVIFYYRDNSVLAKYSMGIVTGYDSDNLVITNATAGEFIIKLQAEVTRTAKLENIFIEVKVRYSNANYSNSNFDSIIRDFMLGQIKDSISGSNNTF